MLRPAVALLMVLLAAPTVAADFLVIAHRGASGSRPEHTLAGYEKAVRDGADFIEPDLVMTKDGLLVARHDVLLAQVDPATGEILERTTNVADHPEFKERMTTRTVDGKAVTGWFAMDFTLAELRTLRAVERMPELRPTSAAFDGIHGVPTLDEIVALAEALGDERGRPVGLYPELKHPSFHREAGLPMEEELVRNLTRFDGPTVVQSFEPTSLQTVRRVVDQQSQYGPKLRPLFSPQLVQLIAVKDGPADAAYESFAAMTTPEILQELKRFADGVGVDKSLVLTLEDGGMPGEPTSLVADAHAAGLLVHAWTLRKEDRFLAPGLRARDGHEGIEAELRALLDAGVDGVFTDNTDLVVDAMAKSAFHSPALDSR